MAHWAHTRNRTGNEVEEEEDGEEMKGTSHVSVLLLKNKGVIKSGP